MSKKLLTLILTLALLASGIGLGIHLLHKEALAQVQYLVEVFDETPGEQQMLFGATIMMLFDPMEGWIEADELQEGKYEVIRDDAESLWKIRIDFPENYTGANPAGNPIDGTPSLAYQWWAVWEIPE